MARGPIFPSDKELEARRVERERYTSISARLRERTRQEPQRGEWPVFVSELERDVYLGKLVANGYQVKRKTTDGLFTVVSIDRRKGK